MVHFGDRLKIKIQLMCGEAVALGPGKADLLSAISTAGSISGAARAMGMSYRRAWLLVNTMNEAFRSPLVESTKGGVDGGHAALTRTGRAVLRAYESLVTRAASAFGPLLKL